MKNIRVGVIGVGNIGTAHASSIHANEIEGMELGALCDIDEIRRRVLSDEFGVPIMASYEELIDSGKVDAVIIATPHYFHPTISMYALKKGLHVLCEKPIGVYTQGLQELVRAGEESGKSFCVMLNQRANKLYTLARDIVKSGKIGKILRSVWIITNWYRTQEYYDSGSWRGSWQGEGGGVLMNQAPHNLDLWQWICDMPKRVYAVCNEGKYHNIEVEDEATILAEYEDGSSGVFITSTGDKYGTNRLEITGEKGKLLLEKGCLTFENDEGKEVVYDEEYNGHRIILQNFANSILKGEELISPASDAVNQLRLCNMAYLSSWKNEWVDIDFDENEYMSYLKRKIEQSRGISRADGKNLFEKNYKKRWTTNW
ncbi:MAG: Gfo/Idh/MocA family oxidoreductase [Clostridia bacterium]|nr:Gfo/Idh/MocA family oxidoreductase [Clostridia bacterium]